jgi:hypothetical protein
VKRHSPGAKLVRSKPGAKPGAKRARRPVEDGDEEGEEEAAAEMEMEQDEEEGDADDEGGDVADSAFLQRCNALNGQENKANKVRAHPLASPIAIAHLHRLASRLSPIYSCHPSSRPALSHLTHPLPLPQVKAARAKQFAAAKQAAEEKAMQAAEEKAKQAAEEAAREEAAGEATREEAAREEAAREEAVSDAYVDDSSDAEGAHVPPVAKTKPVAKPKTKPKTKPQLASKPKPPRKTTQVIVSPSPLLSRSLLTCTLLVCSCASHRHSRNAPPLLHAVVLAFVRLRPVVVPLRATLHATLLAPRHSPRSLFHLECSSLSRAPRTPLLFMACVCRCVLLLGGGRGPVDGQARGDCEAHPPQARLLPRPQGKGHLYGALQLPHSPHCESGHGGLAVTDPARAGQEDGRERQSA